MSHVMNNHQIHEKILGENQKRTWKEEKQDSSKEVLKIFFAQK